MRDINKLIYFIFLYSFLLAGEFSNSSCISSLHSRDVVRNEYTFPDTIQSEHFVIHFTTSDLDSQFVNNQWFNLQSNYSYAQSIIEHLELAYSQYMQKGWESPPPDCNELIEDITSPYHCINYGGNSLYDVYLANDAAGMVVPENLYPVEPYTSGYTSFMKISTLLNEYDILPTWSYHVIAHELHHAIQLRYGYSVSGNPGNYMFNAWIFEQTATYMENVIYPGSIHLQTMLSNCGITSPLTFPEYSIDYGYNLYQYRSALWQKFLVESLGDSSIIRSIWEKYGLQYATGVAVSLFPIFDIVINDVSDNNYSLSDAYNEYAVWKYFTGERAIPEEYFLEADSYCTSTTTFLEDSPFFLLSDKGSSIFIQLSTDHSSLFLNISDEYLINIQHLLDNGIVNNSIIIENEYLLTLDNIFESHGLSMSTPYTGGPSQEIEIEILIDIVLGDINSDNIINILDIVAIIELILENEYNNIADINGDNSLDVLDIVIIIELILF